MRLVAAVAELYSLNALGAVSCLPDNLRCMVWDRTALVGEFMALVKEDLVCGATDIHREPQYWNSMIDQILVDRNKFDYEFSKRLFDSKEV